MKVGRMNFKTGKMDEIDSVPVLSYKEPLIVTVDQSSKSTGMTIISHKTGLKEVMCFTRKYNEDVGTYLKQLEQWMFGILDQIRLLEFAPEMWFTSGHHTSDKVMKQVFMVMENIYKLGSCLDANGKPVQIKKHQSKFEPINNRTWQSVMIPPEYRKMYSDETDAYVAFANQILPSLAPAGADCCASFLMSLYLVKTKYGDMTLRPSKQNVDYNHYLSLTAIPLDPLDGRHPMRIDLMKKVLQDPDVRTERDLEKKFYEGFAKRYISVLKNFPYEDRFIGPVKQAVNTTIGLSLKNLPKEELDKEVKVFSSLKLDSDNFSLREIEMVDNMTVEEMFRAFTGRSKDIYYMVVEPSLHYNYLISQYRLQLLKKQKVLLIGFRHEGGII